MSQELFYTSAPRGLKPGTKGFCTVAMTAGMPALLVERLEGLSGYRPLYPASHPQATQNPVAYAHWRLSMGQRAYSVLSRICFAGFDYTQRSNKFAHHLVLGPGEQPQAGPAWLLRTHGLMQAEWSGEPAVLERGRPIPNGESPPRVCQAWAAVTGDAGWAGVLAGSFMNDPSRPAYIIYAPGTDILALIDEAVALLPTSHRWQVTFNTYFTDLPAGVTCAWRCCVAGSAATQDAARPGVSALVLDLTAQLGPAPDSESVRVARSGPVSDTSGPGLNAQVAPEESVGLTRQTADYAIHDDATGVPGSRTERQLVAVDAGAEPTGVVDQSWMPPFDATITERESADEKKPKRSMLPLLTVCLLWPLTLAAALWFGSWVSSHQQTEPNVHLNATIARLESENRKLTQKNEELEASLKEVPKQIETAKAEGRLNPDLNIWITRAETRPTGTMFSQAQLDDRTKAITQKFGLQLQKLEGKLRDLEAQLRQPTATTAPTNIAAAPFGPAPVISLPGEPPLYRVSFPKLQVGQARDLSLWPRTAGVAKFQVVLNSAMRLKSQQSGKAIAQEYLLGRLNSIAEFEPLGQLYLKDGSLCLKWFGSRKDEDCAIAGELEYAYISMLDDADRVVMHLQFFDPVCKVLSMAQNEQYRPAGVVAKDGSGFEVRAAELTGSWQHSRSGASVVLNGPSGATFRVLCDARSGAISTDWDAQYQSLTKLQQNRQRDRDLAAQALPMKLTNDKVPAWVPDTAQEKAREFSGQFRLYSQRSLALAETEAQLRDLEGFRGTVALQLKNGVLVALVEFGK